MNYRCVGRPYRYQLLVYQLVPSVEIESDEVLFTRCFDVLELLDGLRGLLYERQHRTRGELDVSEAFSGGSLFDFHIFVFVIARNVSTGRGFRPHGITVAAPTCGGRVRGGGPDERVKGAEKTHIKDTLQKQGVP